MATLPKEERAGAISKGAQNWTQDLAQLRELIGGKFLVNKSQQLVVPMVTNLNS